MARIKKALVELSKVVNVTVLDDENLPEGFEAWVDCPDEVAPNWDYDGVNFTAPIPPTPEEIEAAAQAKFERLIDEIGNMPRQDQLTFLWKWDAWKIDNPAGTKAEFVTFLYGERARLISIFG